MNFKKRLISLLIAVLLVFNSIPIGHAVLGNLSIVGADTVGVENALKEAVTDMTYGWDGRTYRFPSSILATVEAGHEVYLLADTQVDGLDEENEIPKVGEKAVNVTFTNIRLAGNDADQYIISELEEPVSFSKEIKILPKTLKISPAMTQAFYGQNLPSRGRVSVNENYKDQLVRKEERVEVSCTFTFDFDGAVQEGSYPLKEVSDIQLKGPDSGNYKAEVENQDDLVFVIAPYETDAVAEDPDAAVSDNGEGYIHNGKQEAHLVAPENFLISITGALDGEWFESVTVDLEETEAGAFKEITYYLRNNDRESTEYKAVCQKTYSYSAMPMPTVIGIELVELEMQKVVEDATITYKPDVRDKDDAVYANGDMQVVVYVTGASYEQETEIILSVNGVETVKPADEVILEDGRYTYKAAFDISSVDGESIIYELKAYARNSSGTGEIYPAENCRDTYIGCETSVTKPLILDRKSPDARIIEIETIRKFVGYYDYPEKLVGTFTAEDIHAGVAKVEYKWDNKQYQEYKNLNKPPYKVELNWYETLAIEGKHTLYLRVTDKLGNVTEISLTQSESVDSKPPVIDSVLVEGAVETANGFLAQGEVKILVKAHDDNSDANSGVSGIQKVLVVGKVFNTFDKKYHDYSAQARLDQETGMYVLSIMPDIELIDVAVQAWDMYGYAQLDLNQIPMYQQPPVEGEEGSTEERFYQSNKLYVESTKPSVNFDDAKKLGFDYGDENYWFGIDDKEEKLTIDVKEDGVISGVKQIVVTDYYVNADGTEAKTERRRATYIFGSRNAKVEIPLSEFSDGTHKVVVEVWDHCGNMTTKDFVFTLVLTEPKTGDIVPDEAKIRKFDNDEWFSPTDSGDYLTIRIGTEKKSEKLSKIILTVNGKVREYLLNGGKYELEDDENGGSYIDISTADPIFKLKVPADDEDYKSHYEVTAVFVDKAGNASDLSTKIVYVDREAPVITKITVQKKDETLLNQIVRILSFGIFSNNDLVFRVYCEDGPGDVGVSSAIMKYSDQGEELAMEKDANIPDCYFIEVSENDVTKLGTTISFRVKDKFGKDDVKKPLMSIENANNKDDKTEKFFVMVESTVPVMGFDLADSDAIAEDGKVWYNGMQENTLADGTFRKPLNLIVQDLQSGLYSIVIDVNGKKETLFPESGQSVSSPYTDAFDRTFDAYKSLLDGTTLLADGEYRIAIKVVDNAGNTSTIEDVYYIDTVKPVIDKITFSTPTADGVEEIAGDGILSADAPVVYSYFFQKDFDITLHVSDQGPSSGLHHVDYWFNNTNGEAKTAEIRDGKALIDVPENFKGMVYYRVWDMAGNCSEVMTTNAFVVDAEAPAIEIKYDAVTTDYKDAAGNPLYTQTKTFTVTITDLVSGLNQFGYVKNAELHKVEHIGDTVAKDDPHKVGDILPGGWRIEKMDANLVTVVTQTFSFAEDDNDIQMFFNAMDQAENKKENVASAVFTIDKTAPKILVDFGSDNDDDVYYNQNRIATITVTERNFNEGLIRVMIENRYGNVPGYTFRHDDNTKHTATINFDEGDYTFDLTGKDLGGHEAEVTFAGGNEKLFYVDKTVPFISENFYEFANAQENSFNTDKTATITIVEHNFDPNLTNLRITRKAAGGEHSHNGMVDVTNEILRGNKWNKNVDTYTISFTFSEDAVYYVEIAPVDLASNHGAKHNTVVFEIDKTVPVVSAKNGQAVAPDATELLDIYPYDRRNDPAPTVDFADNNIASIEYTLITYIPKYMGNGLTVVEPVVERGTIQGSRFTLENFEEDGIYSVELVAVDVAGNRSEINYNTYARMVNQDVLAFILDSNVKDQTGLFSLEYEDGEAISKKPDGFMDLRILVMTPADTPIEIVLRDTNGKETLTTAGLISLESVYGVNVHTFALPADFFRENFQDDIDTEMHLTVRNQGGRIDLARIHIDSIKPTCDVPEELCKWAWFFGEEDRTFTITNISEKLEEADCRVYDNGEMIPFVYSAEEDTLTFTLSKGWHNIGFILSDAAGNANIGQEVGNIHIGYFWCYFIAAGFTALVAVAAALYLYRRRQILQEMMDEA